MTKKKIWTVYDPTKPQIRAYSDRKQAHARLQQIREDFREKRIDVAPVLQEWNVSDDANSECWIMIAGGLLGLFGTESDAKQAESYYKNDPSKIPNLTSSQIEIHKLQISSSPYIEAPQIAAIFENYSTIAGAAAEFELRTRLLADKTPELRPFSVKDKLHSLEEKIVNHFAAKLSEEEVQFLSSTRKVRNKLVHNEFDALMEAIETLYDEPLDRDRLVKVLLDQNSGQTIDQFDQQSFSGIFELLLSYASSGGFQKTYDTFQRAIDIINKCISESGNNKRQ